ncbi:hypothetical protein CV102_11925 [Natronococcus pandeyae]|uniref:CARDB domain-containing protein n=1 Tax=Natronococcus pandeyae TaxID=2055836 RepID=A0A8J8Q4W7_9EURY|nr:hypothetical protein [Natronococcus pandeyae]TYL38503.1 hypothetical protein CV102_11925 [Natronococcus pandeyae]
MWGKRPLRRRVLQGATAGTVAVFALGATRTKRAESADETTVRIRETNTPVETGEWLEVTVDLENRGSETAVVDSRLVVGHDPETVADATVSVDPGSSETITLGYETARVANTQQFPVRVEAAGGSDERTATVIGLDDDGSAAIRPADEVTVRPETSVLFEVASTEPLEPGDVEWDVDDDVAGDLALATDYTYATGIGAYLAEPDAEGTYDVRATVPANGDTATHEWTMQVASDGPEPPSITDLTTDPGADAVVGVDETVEVDLTAHDPEGTLDRLVWIEGQNHTVVAVDDLSGRDDDATFAREHPGWIAAGYPTMARVVCEDGRTSDLVTDDGPEIRPPFAVEILETNAPVTGGERLEVTVAVENEGHMMMIGDTTQEIELLVGREPERVDSATVTVDAGTSETVVLGYETYPVERDDEFPIRVETADDSDERTVRVHGTGD